MKHYPHLFISYNPLMYLLFDAAFHAGVYVHIKLTDGLLFLDRLTSKDKSIATMMVLSG